MMGFGWDMGPANWIWMVGGLLVMIGIVVLIVWGVTAVARGGQAAVPPAPGRPTANEILRERFARGEISEQEFQQAAKALGPDR